MAESFKVGDIVRLKSGGPSMTVTSFEDDTSGGTLVWCDWFDDKQTKQDARFPVDSLQAY